MILYKVRPGDTLAKIAAHFHVGVESIRQLNTLPNMSVVPGLYLMIPSTQGYSIGQHVIAPGETLAQVATRYQVPLEHLLYINDSEAQAPIPAGQTVLVPYFVTKPTGIEADAYLIVTGTARDLELVRQNAGVLTYVNVFSYRLNNNGELLRPPFSLPPVAGVKYLMVVTNTLTSGQFSPDIAHAIVSSTAIQEKLIRNLIAEMRQRGFSGVNLDLERVPPADRHLYNAFVGRVAAALQPLGYLVSIAVPSKASDMPENRLVGAYDYQALGRLVDRVMLMTYDYGYPQGTPQAVAPVNVIRTVLHYALSLIDSQKAMLGIPLYGYDWPLPQTPTHPASIIMDRPAKLLAIKQNAHVTHDTNAVAPYFFYRKDSIMRLVFYNDSATSLAKCHLVKEFNMRGLFYWALGFDSPHTWVSQSNVFRAL